MMDDEVQDVAMAIAAAIINMRDEDVRQSYAAQGIDWAWHLALDIADEGPQNDMERRILAFAMQRRLEGK